MAEGWATASANGILDALCRNVSWAPATGGVYVQLHTGAPGSAGTSNVATETTRKAVTFGTAASGGSIANTVAVTWTGIAGSQDATHFTLWTASSSGTFLASGTITANAYTAGDTYTAGVGAITLSVPTAS